MWRVGDCTETPKIRLLVERLPQLTAKKRGRQAGWAIWRYLNQKLSSLCWVHDNKLDDTSKLWIQRQTKHWQLTNHVYYALCFKQTHHHSRSKRKKLSRVPVTRRAFLLFAQRNSKKIKKTDYFELLLKLFENATIDWRIFLTSVAKERKNLLLQTPERNCLGSGYSKIYQIKPSIRFNSYSTYTNKSGLYK